MTVPEIIQVFISDVRHSRKTHLSAEPTLPSQVSPLRRVVYRTVRVAAVRAGPAVCRPEPAAGGARRAQTAAATLPAAPAGRAAVRPAPAGRPRPAGTRRRAADTAPRPAQPLLLPVTAVRYGVNKVSWIR